jgi:GTPase Era involved in 16S rRNA processing
MHLCEEVGRPIDLLGIVFEDNQPVIDLTKTLSSKVTRSKHFFLLIEFIREQVMERLIKLQKIPTESNVVVMNSILKRNDNIINLKGVRCVS